MSTLEKFGILVILILVVIIGVVAVWGVGGEESNPFEATPPDGGAVAVDPGLPPTEPGADAAAWPGGAAPVATTGPVAPPALGTTVTPAASPEAATAPGTSRGGTTYTVKKGDTLARIAKETLGDSSKWQLIVDANPGLNPRRLKIAQVLSIPAGTDVASKGTGPTLPPVKSFAPNPVDGPSDPAGGEPVMKTAPAPVPASEGTREVEVRSGDTLYEISRRELGDPNLYYKILKVNPGLDPKRIRPGQKIKVPAAE